MTRTNGPVLASIGFAILALTSACASPSDTKPPARLHALGATPFLVFSPTPRKATSASQTVDSEPRPGINIPILGEGLDSPDIKIEANISGIGPLSEEVDFKIDGNNITISQSYLANAKTMDPLRVVVALKDKNGRILSLGARKFELYEADDYRREYLRKRVSPARVHAFPLTKSETQRLFGKVVESLYYAVRLSIRNTEDRDVLINTGLINAYGTAQLVTGARDTSYSFPIEVAPQSLQHVYAVVRDGKSKRPREFIFRTLTFAGTIGTAIVTTFDASTRLVESFALYTGTGIPALGRLFPDPVPAYLKNLVDFSAPELIKVPRGGSVAHKYLFFSKTDLEAALLDPEIQGKSAFASLYPSAFVDLLPPSGSQSAVVATLNFDTLDIPFDVVVGPDATATEASIGELENTLRDQVALLPSLQQWADKSDNSQLGVAGVSAAELDTLIEAVKTAAKAATSDSGENANDAEKLTRIADILPRATPDKVGETLAATLYDSSTINSDRFFLKRALSELLQGRSPDTFEQRLTSVQGRIQQRQATITLYDAVAEVVSTTEVVADELTDKGRSTLIEQHDLLQKAASNAGQTREE